MRKHRIPLLVATVASLLVAAAIFGFFSSTRSRIHAENLTLIKRGMTEAEIEQLLGCPAGNYASSSSLPMYVIPWHMHSSQEVRAKGAKEWVDNEACVAVFFDERGQVTEVCPGTFVRRSEGWLEKVRRWCGL